MNDNTKKILKKYNIDESKIGKFDFLDNGDLENKILESGKRLLDLLLPVIASIEFSEFEKALKDGNYNEAYSSQVFKSIERICSTDNITILKKGTRIYRARIVKDTDDLYRAQNGICFEDNILRGYNWIHSKEPAIGISSDGRANCKYSSYFYCASSAATAVSEIKANIGDYISLATFVINQDVKLIQLREKDILTATNITEGYLHHISKAFSVPISYSEDYRLTQFISDEIRKFGVDGICYKSHFTNDDNYVIFNCSQKNMEFLYSRIVQLYSQQLSFIDYSSKCTISTKKIPKPSETEVEERLSYIIGMMKASELRGQESVPHK